MATNFTSQLHPGIFLEQKGTFDIISKIKVFFLFFFFCKSKDFEVQPNCRNTFSLEQSGGDIMKIFKNFLPFTDFIIN